MDEIVCNHNNPVISQWYHQMYCSICSNNICSICDDIENSKKYCPFYCSYKTTTKMKKRDKWIDNFLRLSEKQRHTKIKQFYRQHACSLFSNYKLLNPEERKNAREYIAEYEANDMLRIMVHLIDQSALSFFLEYKLLNEDEKHYIRNFIMKYES